MRVVECGSGCAAVGKRGAMVCTARSVASSDKDSARTAAKSALSHQTIRLHITHTHK